MEFDLMFFGKSTSLKKVFDMLPLVSLQLDYFSKIFFSMHISIAVEKL